MFVCFWSVAARWAARCWMAGLPPAASIRWSWWSRRAHFPPTWVRQDSGSSGAPACPVFLPGFDPDVVVLAVKPQVMDEVVPGYAGFVRPGTVFLSIAAGKTIDYFTALLGADAAIVRAMPNTPASVGRGMTVAVPNAAVTPEQRRLCETLMGAVGQVAWVDDEGMIDAVTAVSGGGPAYVFLLIETLAKAGVAAGLPEDLAMTDRAGDRRRQRRAGGPVDRAGGVASQERDKPQWHDAGGPGSPDGGRRNTAAVRPRHRRGDRPVAGTGRLRPWPLRR